MRMCPNHLQAARQPGGDQRCVYCEWDRVLAENDRLRECLSMNRYSVKGEEFPHAAEAARVLEARLDTAIFQIEDWRKYVALLGEELRGVVGIAAAHGWKSSCYEEGRRLRQKLGLGEHWDDDPKPPPTPMPSHGAPYPSEKRVCDCGTGPGHLSGCPKAKG